MNHNTKKQAREYDSPLIQSLLAEITPEEHERTVYKMRMSMRIEDGIIAKGWNKGEFAKKMGKNPSEVSKWLSGSHNFTSDTLTDIQRVLGIQLLCAEEIKPVILIREVIKVEYKTVFFSAKVLGIEKPYERKVSSNYRQQLAVANA